MAVSSTGLNGHIHSVPNGNKVELSFMLGNLLNVKLYSGDVTRAQCDAIVCPTGPSLGSGGAVAHAIFKSFGLQLRNGNDQYAAQLGGILQVGENHAVKLSGPLLNPAVKYVISVVSPYQVVSPKACKKDLEQAVTGVILTAAKNNCTSIAIPTIGGGAAGIPIQTCAKGSWDALQNVKNDHQINNLKEIHFIEFDKQKCKEIRDIFMKKLGASGGSQPASNSDIKPSKSGGSQPASSSDIKPSKSGGSQPASSSDIKPSKSGGSQPASSGDIKPSKSGGSQPASSSVIKPSKSGGRQTASSGDAKPPNVTQPGQAEKPSEVPKPPKVQKEMAPSDLPGIEECDICTEAKPENLFDTLPCKHKLCIDCKDKTINISKSNLCPTCKQPFTNPRGPQPKGGTMAVSTDPNSHLPGYESFGVIVINYSIPSGVQTAEHPRPGVKYSGTSRTAFLPDNPQGQRVCKLLRKAFDAGLIFTVGRSLTSGQDNTVVWNDIHHKTGFTGPYGYPDPNYLPAVEADLKARGIHE